MYDPEELFATQGLCSRIVLGSTNEPMKNYSICHGNIPNNNIDPKNLMILLKSQGAALTMAKVASQSVPQAARTKPAPPQFQLKSVVILLTVAKFVPSPSNIRLPQSIPCIN